MLSVDAVHERLTAEVERTVAERPAGVEGFWVSLKVAVTVTLPAIDTTQVVVVVQPEEMALAGTTAHVAKVEPVVAARVKVTAVPETIDSVQSVPQVMPVPVTVPAPVHALATVSVYVTGAV